MQPQSHEFDGFEPLVSVIIRSRDRIPWLLELLERVFGQTYRNFEVVVIDSSTETSEEEFARLRAVGDPRLRIIRTPPRGCPAAANDGVRHARGEIVVFMDDDDLPERPDWLWCHVRNFQDPNCLGVNGFQCYPAEHRASENPLFPALRRRMTLAYGPFKEPWSFAYLPTRKVGIEHLNGGNSSLRRSAVLLGGGWDEFLNYHNEHSLFLRLHRRKPEGTYLVFDPDARAIIRKEVPGGLDYRFSGEVDHRVDTLAKYFLWVVGREYPGRIYGLAPLFVPYFLVLAGIQAWGIAVDRGTNRLLGFLRGVAHAPLALARHTIGERPPAHDGFPAEGLAVEAPAHAGTERGEAKR